MPARSGQRKRPARQWSTPAGPALIFSLPAYLAASLEAAAASVAAPASSEAAAEASPEASAATVSSAAGAAASSFFPHAVRASEPAATTANRAIFFIGKPPKLLRRPPAGWTQPAFWRVPGRSSMDFLIRRQKIRIRGRIKEPPEVDQSPDFLGLDGQHRHYAGRMSGRLFFDPFRVETGLAGRPARCRGRRFAD